MWRSLNNETIRNTLLAKSTNTVQRPLNWTFFSYSDFKMKQTRVQSCQCPVATPNVANSWDLRHNNLHFSPCLTFFGVFVVSWKELPILNNSFNARNSSKKCMDTLLCVVIQRLELHKKRQNWSAFSKEVWCQVEELLLIVTNII